MSARRTAALTMLAWLLAACAPLRMVRMERMDKPPANEIEAPVVPWASVTPVTPAATTEPVTPAEPPAVAKEARPPADDVERLLSYFERLKRLPGAELASEFNRISYAMTLASPGTTFNDDARALELLNPLVKKSENGLRPLVVLLTTFIQERRRLGGDLAAVQQKLDALKSLERTLIERDQNNSGRK